MAITGPTGPKPGKLFARHHWWNSPFANSGSGGCDVVDAGVTEDDVVDSLAWRLITRLADPRCRSASGFTRPSEPVWTADRSQMGRQRLSQLDENSGNRDPGLLKLLTLMKIVPQTEGTGVVAPGSHWASAASTDGAVGYRIGKQPAFVQRNLSPSGGRVRGLSVDVDAAPVCSRHGLLLFR